MIGLYLTGSPLAPEPSKNLPENRPPALDRQLKDQGRPLNFHNPAQPSTAPATPLVSILGPDGWLTAAEQQQCISLGLCMYCSLPGHLARNCLRQSQKSLSTAEVWAALVKESLSILEILKKGQQISCSLESHLPENPLGAQAIPGCSFPLWP